MLGRWRSRLWLGQMEKSNHMGPRGDDSLPVRQELRRFLEAGNGFVNRFHIVQIGDRIAAGDQAARLAREVEHLLLRSSGRQGLSAAGRAGRSTKASVREGVFRYDGRDTWQIGLSGQFRSYRDAVGLHQLHCLLQRTGERVSVIELAQVRGQQVVLNQLCSADVADRKTRAQCRAQLEDPNNQLTIARDAGNSETIGVLDAEIEILERHLNGSQSRGGPGRRFGDQGERLRHRVRSALRSSLGKIIVQAPDLGEHLQASIKLGYECGSFPVSPVHWILLHSRPRIGVWNSPNDC